MKIELRRCSGFSALLISASLLAPAVSVAQGTGTTTNRPETARPDYVLREGLGVLWGIGPTFGWFGLSLDHYLADGAVSLFGSAGYHVAEPDGDQLEAVSLAAGIRGYVGGARHRGFLEVGVSDVMLQKRYLTDSEGEVTGWEEDQVYGPTVQAGWRFATDGGFTILLSSGLGFGLPDGPNGFLWGFGMGYTWP